MVDRGGQIMRRRRCLHLAGLGDVERKGLLAEDVRPRCDGGQHRLAVEEGGRGDVQQVNARRQQIAIAGEGWHAMLGSDCRCLLWRGGCHAHKLDLLAKGQQAGQVNLEAEAATNQPDTQFLCHFAHLNPACY